MNTDHDRRRLPAAFDNAADEREWQLQERALDEVRRGVTGGDELLVGHRQVAQALRRAPAPDLPADFAASLAARVVIAPALDTRVERHLLRALVVVLALSAAVAVAVYGGQWLHATLALLPAATTNWGLALGACIGLTGALQWHGRWRFDPR